jgi:hypothetical protein
MILKRIVLDSLPGVELQQTVDGLLNALPFYEHQRRLLASINVPFKDEKIKLDDFLVLKSTKELIKRICEYKNSLPSEVLQFTTYNGTEYVFMDNVLFFAALEFIDKRVYLHIHNMVLNTTRITKQQLIQDNEVIAQAIHTQGILPGNTYDYHLLNVTVGDACGCSYVMLGANRRYLWEYATCEQLNKRDHIQHIIKYLLEDQYIKTFEDVIVNIKRLA